MCYNILGQTNPNHCFCTKDTACYCLLYRHAQNIRDLFLKHFRFIRPILKSACLKAWCEARREDSAVKFPLSTTALHWYSVSIDVVLLCFIQMDCYFVSVLPDGHLSLVYYLILLRYKSLNCIFIFWQYSQKEHSKKNLHPSIHRISGNWSIKEGKATTLILLHLIFLFNCFI